MTNRDPRRQRRRRGGARLSDTDSHSPEAVGVGEGTYGSPVQDPLTVAASSSFMHTPRVDARIGNPFVDPNQVPVLNQDAGLHSVSDVSHLESKIAVLESMLKGLSPQMSSSLRPL